MEPTPARPDQFLQVRFEADGETAGQLASALVAGRFRGLQIRLVWVGIFALAIVVGLTNDILVPVLAGVLVFSVVSTLITRRTLIQVCRAAYPPGSVHIMVFTDDSIRVTGPSGSFENRYIAYREMWSTRNAVVLRQRNARVLQAFPRGAVPDTALALLRSGVGS